MMILILNIISKQTIEFDELSPFELPSLPGRCEQISFSEKQIRFPRGHFHEKEKIAIALSSFANHELMAIEMMAAALLMFPHDTAELLSMKKGIINTIKDEQKHFSLYNNRLKEFGYEFGHFPISNFFWSYMKKIGTPASFFSFMALTIENANLDFSHYYEKIFREIGDFKTADIMKVVYEDEISHVALGGHYLGKWKEDKSLWEYYKETLPWPITPARAKGKQFVAEARKKAKLDEDFIQQLESYQDEFPITKRKEWKLNNGKK